MRWFPPGTPVSSTRKSDFILAVAEALNPNKPRPCLDFMDVSMGDVWGGVGQIAVAGQTVCLLGGVFWAHSYDPYYFQFMFSSGYLGLSEKRIRGC